MTIPTPIESQIRSLTQAGLVTHLLKMEEAPDTSDTEALFTLLHQHSRTGVICFDAENFGVSLPIGEHLDLKAGLDELLAQNVIDIIPAADLTSGDTVDTVVDQKVETADLLTRLESMEQLIHASAKTTQDAVDERIARLGEALVLGFNRLLKGVTDTGLDIKQTVHTSMGEDLSTAESTPLIGEAADLQISEKLCSINEQLQQLGSVEPNDSVGEHVVALDAKLDDVAQVLRSIEETARMADDRTIALEKMSLTRSTIAIEAIVRRLGFLTDAMEERVDADHGGGAVRPEIPDTQSLIDIVIGQIDTKIDASSEVTIAAIAEISDQLVTHLEELSPNKNARQTKSVAGSEPTNLERLSIAMQTVLRRFDTQVSILEAHMGDSITSRAEQPDTPQENNPLSIVSNLEHQLDQINGKLTAGFETSPAFTDEKSDQFFNKLNFVIAEFIARLEMTGSDRSIH